MYHTNLPYPHEDFLALVRDIVPGLGDGNWDVTEYPDRPMVYIADGDLVLRLEPNPKNSRQIQVACSLDKSLYDHLNRWQDETTPSMNAAINKGADRLRAEIERRVLDDAIKLVGILSKRREEYREMQRQIQAGYEKIVEALDGQAEVRGDTDFLNGRRQNVVFGGIDRLDRPYGKAENLYRGRLDLTLNQVTPDEAAAVLRCLKKLRQV